MELHDSRIILRKDDCFCAKSWCSCSITASRGFTSPSLCLRAALATSAPPGRPPPPVRALPCCGRGCAGVGGSSSRPANTGMYASHGGPPAGPGSTAHLLPVKSKTKKKGLTRGWANRTKLSNSGHVLLIFQMPEEYDDIISSHQQWHLMRLHYSIFQAVSDFSSSRHQTSLELQCQLQSDVTFHVYIEMPRGLLRVGTNTPWQARFAGSYLASVTAHASSHPGEPCSAKQKQHRLWVYMPNKPSWCNSRLCVGKYIRLFLLLHV